MFLPTFLSYVASSTIHDQRTSFYISGGRVTYPSACHICLYWDCLPVAPFACSLLALPAIPLSWNLPEICSKWSAPCSQATPTAAGLNATGEWRHPLRWTENAAAIAITRFLSDFVYNLRATQPWVSKLRDSRTVNKWNVCLLLQFNAARDIWPGLGNFPEDNSCPHPRVPTFFAPPSPPLRRATLTPASVREDQTWVGLRSAATGTRSSSNCGGKPSSGEEVETESSLAASQRTRICRRLGGG